MPHWLALYLWLKTHDKEDRRGEDNSWTVLKELRGLCWHAAGSMGFPWCQFRPMPRRAPWTSCLVVPGRMAWEGMCQGAPIDDLADALLELERMAYDAAGAQRAAQGDGAGQPATGDEATGARDGPEGGHRGEAA